MQGLAKAQNARLAPLKIGVIHGFSKLLTQI